MGTTLYPITEHDRWAVDDATGALVGIQTAKGDVSPTNVPNAAGALTAAQVAELSKLLNPPPSGYIAKPHGTQIDFCNQLSLTSWTGGTGTLTITREVTLDGRPTLRVDMPAACTEVILGRTSGVSVPAGWATPPATTWGCPVYLLDYTPFTNFQIYIGDATYAAQILQSYNPNNYPFPPRNGWHTPQFRDGWGAIGTELTSPAKVGTLTDGSVAQAKLRVTKSAGTPATFYCSWAGPLPVEQPRILWTADDGSDDWYSFLWPAAKLYGIPFALGFDREYCTVLKTGWCSEAQIAEMAADTGGVLELYSHSSNNKSVSDLGAAGYLATDDTTWAWLQSLGVKNSRIYHPWVQGLYDATAIAGMQQRGLKICRAAYNVTDGRAFHPSMCDSGNLLANGVMQGRYTAPNGFATLNTTTVAQGKAAIDQTIARGGVLIIMGHRFVDASPAQYNWLKSDMLALMQYAAAKEREGLLRNIRASELAANIVVPS